MAAETPAFIDAAPPPPSISPSTIYRSLSTYLFDQDPEYLSGLSAILGHPETPPTQEELTSNPDLILQARCFYFARRNNLPPINPAEYQQWLSQNSTNTHAASEAALPSHPTQPHPAAAAAAPPTIATTTTTTTNSTSSDQQQQQPPYPTSFAAIVDLITRNVPVPGIEEIPDTVLEHGSSKVDHTPRRRKPWESSAEAALPILAPIGDGADGVRGDGGTGEGAGSGLGVVNAGTTPTAAGQGAQVAEAMTDTGADDGVADIETAQRRGDDAGGQSQEGKAGVNGHLATGEGVVKILQEGAIPDSGLLARD